MRVRSDAELLEAWRGGDTAAGDALFERHFDTLYRFFRSKLSDGIEDLVHDTFLSCVQGPAFRGESSFRTYLFTVARNALYAQLKKQQRRGAEVDVGEQSVADLGLSPSGILVKHAEEKLLLAALRAIPLDLQIALELFYWEDLTAPEIATVLAIPEGTVRSRLRRAREALDERLAALSHDAALLTSTTTGLETWAKRLREQVHPSAKVNA